MRQLIAIHLLLSIAAISAQSTPNCDKALWNFTAVRGTIEECDKHPDMDSYKVHFLKYANVPLLQGVYCFNNGSGICKAFAGRFEFYLNTFTDKAIGPAPKSSYVDDYGYHQRVPVAYNINGSILYADRAINWAETFAFSREGQNISLLSATDFNWCSFVENGYWPYKSAIKDAKTNGRYHIYFYNRQSCIFDTQTKNRQHFNTRFLHNSSLRLDLDSNPLIFAMEDHLAGEIRLVKNKRQHWYEVEYKVLEKPTPNINYFVLMDSNERTPCKLNGTNGTPLLSKNAYHRANSSNICLTDGVQANRTGKNSKLISAWCGSDEADIADYTFPDFKQDPGVINEVHLHGIPRYPRSTENFYGVDVDKDWEWETFAKDGYIFSATTTIPLDTEGNKVRVISLYAFYKGVGKVTEYEEYYPVPYLSEYDATYRKGDKPGLSQWVYDRMLNAKRLTNLNYVDDIAYLHKCKTVLVIFGPLYTEVPASNFTLETKSPVGSIRNLSLFEMTSAFFAMPDGTDTIYFYHRTNYITDHKYTCSGDGRGLVTASKISGKYSPRVGPGMPSWISPSVSGTASVAHSEESFFKTVGLYKGELGSPEAPDPREYPLGSADPEGPKGVGSNMVVYIAIAVGAILIIAMCITCLLTFRRRRRRHHKPEASLLPPSGTVRSDASGGASSAVPSARSSLTAPPSGTQTMGARHTMRSALGGTQSSRAASGHQQPSLAPTARSQVTSSGPAPARSHASSAATARSQSSSKKNRRGQQPSRATLTNTVRSSGHHRPTSASSSTGGGSKAKPRK